MAFGFVTWQLPTVNTMSKIPTLPPIADKVSPLFIESHSDVSVSTTEARLFRLEKITETLLEEIVHLQGELTALHKPDNDELRFIRSQLKRITEKQDQLLSRVASEEQKSLEKDQTLTHLLQSTRDLEKKTINNQQLILCRRDVLESQLNRLQSGVNAMQEKWRGYQDHIEQQLSEGSERLEKLLESVGTQHREQLVTMKLSIDAQQKSLVCNHRLYRDYTIYDVIFRELLWQRIHGVTNNLFFSICISNSFMTHDLYSFIYLYLLWFPVTLFTPCDIVSLRS